MVSYGLTSVSSIFPGSCLTLLYSQNMEQLLFIVVALDWQSVHWYVDIHSFQMKRQWSTVCVFSNQWPHGRTCTYLGFTQQCCYQPTSVFQTERCPEVTPPSICGPHTPHTGKSCVALLSGVCSVKCVMMGWTTCPLHHQSLFLGTWTWPSTRRSSLVYFPPK